MLTQTQSLRVPVRRFRALALPAVTLFIGAAVMADEPILTDGVAGEGYLLFIGDPMQWDTPVGTEPVTSASGYLSFEPDAEAGAISLSWNGKGKAQFFAAYPAPEDYSGYLEQKSALVLVLRVDTKPGREALIRMGCGYPCGSDADITRLLNALPAEQWLRVSFDLRCFARGGLDIGKVDTPFLITTQGEMALSVAGISIVPDAGPEATIRCED